MKASSSRKQLNIRSDEAYETAHRLAEQLKLPAQEVVLRALRRMAEEAHLEADRLPPEVVAANLKKLDDARRAYWRGNAPPTDVTSDHGWLYDENGLPK